MRPAYYMIRKGEESGELVPGKIIIDSTSGNTGIAYALIGAVKGYKVLLAMPANATIERKSILTAYGADLLLTDPLQGSDGAILAQPAGRAERLRRQVRRDPTAWAVGAIASVVLVGLLGWGAVRASMPPRAWTVRTEVRTKAATRRTPRAGEPG